MYKNNDSDWNISYKIETSCGWNCFWRQTCFPLLITWFCWTEIFTLYLCIYSVICSGWLFLVRTIMYIGHRLSLPIIWHFSPPNKIAKNNVSYAILIRFDLIEFLAVFDPIYYHRKLHRLIGLTHTLTNTHTNSEHYCNPFFFVIYLFRTLSVNDTVLFQSFLFARNPFSISKYQVISNRIHVTI